MGESQPTISRSAAMQGMLTRRGMLRAFAAGGALLAGGVLTSCQKESASGGGGKSSDVTVKIGGAPGADPYPVMPSAATQKKDANSRGYAAALDGWLKQNPGVKLAHINADVQDTEALVAAIGGGTAPDLFIGNVLGSWGSGNIRNAFVQGLAADITDLAEKYKFAEKLNPVVQARLGLLGNRRQAVRPAVRVFGRGSGSLLPARLSRTGRHQRHPVRPDLDLGTGTRDRQGDDVRQAQGHRPGQLELLGAAVGANAHGLLTSVPAPDTKWNWRSDWTTHADTWASAVELFRGMVFDDESVRTDITMDDGQANDAFGRAEVGMWMGNPAALTHSPNDPSAQKFVSLNNKSYEEVVSWIPLPFGDQGYFDGTARYGTAMISFRPDADNSVLDKAVGLHTYMMGPGLTTQMKVINDATKDLRNVYGGYVGGAMIPTNTMIPVFAESLTDLPGSPEEAWGKPIVDAYSAGTKLTADTAGGALLPGRGEPRPVGHGLRRRHQPLGVRAKDRRPAG